MTKQDIFHVKQRALQRYQEFYESTKGIPTHVLCKAASGRGADYRGSTKARLAEVYALEGTDTPSLVVGINFAIEERNESFAPNSPHRLEYLSKRGE